MGFITNVGEHSKDCYFTVKGFQIINICKIVELRKCIFLSKGIVAKMLQK